MCVVLRELALSAVALHELGRRIAWLAQHISHDRVPPIAVAAVAVNGLLVGAAHGAGHHARDTLAAFNLLAVAYCGVIAAAGVLDDVDTPKTAAALRAGAMAGALASSLLGLVSIVTALYGAAAACNAAEAHKLSEISRPAAGVHWLMALIVLVVVGVFIGGMAV